MPLCFGASGSVRARQMPHRAYWAYDVHTFWPVSSHPSSAGVAFVVSDARSEPAPGSLNSWHQISSAVRILASHRSFWSAVPWANSVGPARLSPTRLTSCGARARAYSALKIATCTGDAPRPPYSAGQCRPTHPSAASRACHCRPHSTSSSKVANDGTCPRLAANHSRTSAAKVCSSGVNDRSTSSGYPRAPMDRKRLVIVAMAGGMLLITLDFFGLTVALPKIGEDLRASTSSLLWVVNGDLLAFASPIIAVGRLADIVGRRKVVLTGIVIFVLASAACGFAQSPAQLIIARLVQGVGGGTIFATALSVVSNAFPANERSSAIGIWSGIGCVGSAIGPFVAGVLTQSASWRWFFFLNIPIGIGVIILTLAYVQESRDETFTGRIDWTGFGLITAGMVLFILALQDSGTEGWGSPLIIGSLAAGVVLLAAFAVVETRVRDPLVEFGLFRTLPFAGAAVVSFVGNWMFGSILFFLTLYLQQVLDLKPLETGLVFLPFTFLLVALPPVTGLMLPKYG